MGSLYNSKVLRNKTRLVLHVDRKAKPLAQLSFGLELKLRDLLLEIHAFLLGNDLTVMLHFPSERRNWSHGSSITI